ncbi:monooxygenase [Paramarasmius palmivorus]|uniref:Monooxygenase n=1 Tax=Paramarasmius palmivorus TaxID=297713 RepID=A0AAW0C182_9AGAR
MLTSSMNQAKRIATIGAGPAGLAALKVLLDTNQVRSGKWVVKSFEAREKVGGIWNPAEPLHNPPLTPLYDSMTTNIPHPVMAFTSYPFPPSTPIFPPAATVQIYLEDYATHFDLLPHIQFDTIVVDVSWSTSCKIWTVTLSTGQKYEFDAVIVANGHFRKPRYPETPGLSEWLQSGKVTHSVWYRRPSSLDPVIKKVIVVGNGPSGQDISTELLEHGLTVIHSVSGSSSEDSGHFKKRSAIAQFRSDNSVIFDDGSVENQVDHCILATGYEMDFPFLSPSTLPSSSFGKFPETWTVRNSSYHVFPLAKHMFPVEGDFPLGSLAFMGLLLRGTPLSLFEAQAHAIAKVYANPEVLNMEQERLVILTRFRQFASYEETLVAKMWHKLTEAEAFTYRDELYEFAGLDTRVEDWERDMWLYKVELRREWRALVKENEVDQWISGVGSAGRHEWIALLRRILQRAGVDTLPADRPPASLTIR